MSKESPDTLSMKHRPYFRTKKNFWLYILAHALGWIFLACVFIASPEVHKQWVAVAVMIFSIISLSILHITIHDNGHNPAIFKSKSVGTRFAIFRDFEHGFIIQFA